MTTEVPGPQQTYRTAYVAAVRRLTPRLTRVTFTGTDLGGFTSVTPDQYVKLFFPLPGARSPQLPPPLSGDSKSWYRTYLAMPDEIRSPMRTYTVRAHRPEMSEIDIDFLLHPGAGPGASWAAAAVAGDEVALLGPYGLYSVPDNTEWQLLAGDESALPAIAAIMESLPASTSAQVFIEVHDSADELPLHTAGDVDVHWTHRRGALPGEAVLAAVHAAELPSGQPYAWLSGEAGLVRSLRRHLVRERDVDKRVITFTGYWRQGRSEEDAGRDDLRKLGIGRMGSIDRVAT